MFRIFSSIRKKLLSESKFTRYLTYALGEIVLIVIGILIALEISNANQEKMDARALDGYLSSISQNINKDLLRAQAIYDKRIKLRKDLGYVLYVVDAEYIHANYNPTDVPFEGITFSYEQVSYISDTILSVWDIDYLNANVSGFESLKNTGFLSNLQDTDLEDLLSQYYSLINELITLENVYNDRIIQSINAFTSTNLPGTSAIYTPGRYAWEGEQQVVLSSYIMGIISHPTLQATLYAPHTIIFKYENLILLGNELKRMIDGDRRSLDEQAKTNLVYLHDEYSGSGYAKVLQDGVHTGFYANAQATAEWRNFIKPDDSNGILVLDFPAQAWGTFYFHTGSSVDPANTRDYSKFKSLKIEMRGYQGGEQVMIAMKDITNPEDGSETKIPVTLSTDWTVYTFPLEQFAPTDITQIFMPASIIFENKAAKIAVKTIEFSTD